MTWMEICDRCGGCELPGGPGRKSVGVASGGTGLGGTRGGWLGTKGTKGGLRCLWGGGGSCGWCGVLIEQLGNGTADRGGWVCDVAN